VWGRRYGVGGGDGQEREVVTTSRRTPVQGPWTYERLCAETPVDTVRREIIDGWLYIDGHLVDDPMAQVAAESAAVFHGDAVRELVLAFGRYREDHAGQVYTAPMDVSFDGTVLQPDVFWLPWSAPRHELPITVLPLLVIEVSSPSTRRHDLVRKRRVYERAAVPEYWFVDTDAQRIEAYRLTEGAYGTPTLTPRGERMRSIAVPDFEVDVDAVLGPDEDS
jgi:Uma2 family endonuclease